VFEGSFSPTSSPTFVVVCVLGDSYCDRNEVESYMALICIFFMARDVEHFSCVFWPFGLLLKKLWRGFQDGG
jgi:hypothetical protein